VLRTKRVIRRADRDGQLEELIRGQ
jgi:hypothetical protein